MPPPLLRQTRSNARQELRFTRLLQWRNMTLVLFETPAGYALFKVKDESTLKDEKKLQTSFASAEAAAEAIKLKAFSKFENTVEAVAAATAMIESSLGKSLKKFLTKQIVKKDVADKLIVGDKGLAKEIKDALNIKCVNDSASNELIRGIRAQLEPLLGNGVSASDMTSMRLGLSHSLSRYKLKFSPDKVDTMVVQAIGLLDELDKEINTYAMRVKEWYGWHYPEMQKIVLDTIDYSRVVLKVGYRSDMKKADLSSIIEDEGIVQNLKETAEISMGTELTDMDLTNIKALASEVVNMSEYRTQLFDYLKNRMQAIAPNLTVMVGELVGARLISHAGSLMNLAKHPASTVQILGAEKALFRALKTKHDTPKYGLIYHASLIGQTSGKNKGKISRVLAAKTALSIRVDALGEADEATIAYGARASVEERIRQLEGGGRLTTKSSSLEGGAYDAKAARAAAAPGYNTASDVTGGSDAAAKKKRDRSDEEDEAGAEKKKAKKEKKSKKEKKESSPELESAKKKKKKSKD
jgi:nucleolar protein 58